MIEIQEAERSLAIKKDNKKIEEFLDAWGGGSNPETLEEVSFLVQRALWGGYSVEVIARGVNPLSESHPFVAKRNGNTIITIDPQVNQGLEREGQFLYFSCQPVFNRDSSEDGNRRPGKMTVKIGEQPTVFFGPSQIESVRILDPHTQGK